MSHRWSGWPGAHCQDCGIEDNREICVGVLNHPIDPEHPENDCKDPLCTNLPCLTTMQSITMEVLDQFRDMVRLAIDAYRKDPSNYNSIVLHNSRVLAGIAVSKWIDQGCKEM